MRAIWKRELKSYFQTVTGWLFIAATLALFGLYFYVYNMYYGSTDISSNVSVSGYCADSYDAYPGRGAEE